MKACAAEDRLSLFINHPQNNQSSNKASAFFPQFSMDSSNFREFYFQSYHENHLVSELAHSLFIESCLLYQSNRQEDEMKFQIRKICVWRIGCTIFIILTGMALSQSAHSALYGMKSASQPSRLFSIPSADILKSMEISVSGGGAFGVEGGKTLLRNFIIGLGSIAEVEFTSSGMTNRLTGKSESLPTSSFKVSLIPERYRDHWYIPDIAVQLRSASWQSLEGNNNALQSEYKAYSAYMNGNLHAIDQVQKRFSILYMIMGKRIPGFGSLQLGISQTDVRTKGGYQTIYLPYQLEYTTDEIPEMKKSFLSPMGGFEIIANQNTHLMAEIQAIPLFDYDFKQEKVTISQTWLSVAGVRFFILEWLSLDTGIKYQSDFKGIADAEIDIGVNFVFPVNQVIGKN
jgi:hypothetical protein